MCFNRVLNKVTDTVCKNLNWRACYRDYEPRQQMPCYPLSPVCPWSATTRQLTISSQKECKDREGRP